MLTVAEGGSNVLTLEQAVAMALANSPGLKAAEVTTMALEAQIQAARAERYPRLDARFVFPFVGTESGVSLHQTLWDFRRTSNRIKSRAAEVRSSRFERAARREDLVLQTRIAYATVLALQARLDAFDKAVREQVLRLERAEAFAQLGRVRRIELTRATLNLDRARLNRAHAERDLRDARLQLASLLGLKDPDGITVVPLAPPPRLRANLDDEIPQALQTRPELNRLRAEEEARRADLSATTGDYFPTLFGRTEYRIRGEGAQQPAFIVGLGIRYRLFEGFARGARVKEARANLMRSRFDIDSIEKQLELEIRQAYLRLQSLEDTLDLTAHAAHTATDHQAFVQAQYRIGRASAVDLAEADALLASAQADHLQAVTDAQIALAQLERALGRKLGP